jgi:hypothetical protein
MRCLGKLSGRRGIATLRWRYRSPLQAFAEVRSIQQ